MFGWPNTRLCTACLNKVRSWGTVIIFANRAHRRGECERTAAWQEATT